MTNILGIGIDSIEINRFKDWGKYSKIKLQKLFSVSEIQIYKESNTKKAQILAKIFAVKEASYKAFCSINPNISFLEFCKFINFSKNQHNMPQITIDFTSLGIDIEIVPFISITHTDSVVTAIIILQQKI